MNLPCPVRHWRSQFHTDIFGVEFRNLRRKVLETKLKQKFCKKFVPLYHDESPESFKFPIVDQENQNVPHS